VKTENPTACATVNCKLCKFSDSAVLIVIKRERESVCNRSASKSNHPN
jgi:hypothetical protein